MMNKPSLRNNLLLLFVTLLFLFIGGEIFSRWYFSQTDATNKELQIYQASELLGWELKPGSSAIHGPSDPPGSPPPKIQINSLGMRDNEMTVEKPKNTIRVALLGDSFTFGMVTDQEKIFPAVLEKKLGKKYEVLNFGTIGYATDQEYLQLHEKVLKFSPDIVVVMFFSGNDATELRGHKWILDENGELERIRDIYHIVSKDHQLRRRKKPYGVNSFFFTLLQEKGKVFFAKLGMPVDYPRLLWSNFLPPDHRWGDPKIFKYFEKTKEILLAIKKLNDEHGIKTLITLVPTDFQVNEKYLSKYPGAPLSKKELDDPQLGLRPQTILSAFGKTEKIEMLDLLPIFRSISSDLYHMGKEPHWNVAGHKATADALFQKLSELKWL